MRVVAAALHGSTRKTEMVSRIGGDEFAILLRTGSETVKVSLQRILGKLAATVRNSRWDVTFSIGVVTFTKPPERVEAVIREADKAMYAVKRKGKDGIHYVVQ